MCPCFLFKFGEKKFHKEKKIVYYPLLSSSSSSNTSNLITYTRSIIVLILCTKQSLLYHCLVWYHSLAIVWHYLVLFDTFRQVRLLVNYIDPQFELVSLIGSGFKGCINKKWWSEYFQHDNIHFFFLIFSNLQSSGLSNASKCFNLSFIYHSTCNLQRLKPNPFGLNMFYRFIILPYTNGSNKSSYNILELGS